MTARDWQPGDVGIYASAIVIFGNKGWVWAITGLSCMDQARVAKCARPLVMLDPEDREQVDRLAALVAREAIGSIPTNDATQAALREFANPKPRIEEPRGHLAVVEDADGMRWVNWRDPRQAVVHNCPWISVHDSPGAAREWSDVNAVRILSDGVTQ